MVNGEIGLHGHHAAAHAEMELKPGKETVFLQDTGESIVRDQDQKYRTVNIRRSVGLKSMTEIFICYSHKATIIMMTTVSTVT